MMIGYAEKNTENGNVNLAVSDLVGLLGVSLLLSTFLMYLLLILGNLESGPREACQMLFVVTLAICFAIIWAGAKVITHLKGLPLIIAAAIGGIALCLVMLGILPIDSHLSVVVVGVGVSALISITFFALYAYPEKLSSTYIPAGVVLGALVCLVGASMGSGPRNILMVSIYCMSFGSVVIEYLISPKTFALPAIGNRDSDQRSKISPGSAIMLSITYFELGILICTCASNVSYVFACFTTVVAVGSILFFDSIHGNHINERTIAPFIVPSTVTGLAGMYMFDDTMTLVCLCVLTALCVLYYALGVVALIEHAHISNLSLLRVVGKARMLDYSGAAIGLCVGSLSALYYQSSTLVSARILVISAIAYGFIASFCHRARFPEKDMELQRSEAKGAKNPWRRRCKVVGDRFGLTERQQEVLQLVAQGRNAKHIEAFLMISETTAQTHIRNIYRKTGVHSRQELLDLIESTKLYGEE